MVERTMAAPSGTVKKIEQKMERELRLLLSTPGIDAKSITLELVEIAGKTTRRPLLGFLADLEQLPVASHHAQISWYRLHKLARRGVNTKQYSSQIVNGILEKYATLSVEIPRQIALREAESFTDHARFMTPAQREEIQRLSFGAQLTGTELF